MKIFKPKYSGKLKVGHRTVRLEIVGHFACILSFPRVEKGTWYGLMQVLMTYVLTIK
jgi:hypothetical protein